MYAVETWVAKAAPEENPPRVMELESMDKTVGKAFPSDGGGRGTQPFAVKKSPKRLQIKSLACMLSEIQNYSKCVCLLL